MINVSSFYCPQNGEGKHRKETGKSQKQKFEDMRHLTRTEALARILHEVKYRNYFCCQFLYEKNGKAPLVSKRGTNFHIILRQNSLLLYFQETPAKTSVRPG